jgi:hypothetical protein
MTIGRASQARETEQTKILKRPLWWLERSEEWAAQQKRSERLGMGSQGPGQDLGFSSE